MAKVIPNTAGQYTIEGRAVAVIKDVQRDWNWQLTIPNISNFVTTSELEVATTLSDEVTIRARSIAMPSRGVETIESIFMSQKQYFPGKPIIGSEVTVNFEESENQNVASMLYAWQESIMSIKSGHSNKIGKRDITGSYVTDMWISLIDYAGNASDKVIYFKNAFPTNVGEVALSYSSAESVKFDVTFKFDFWYLMKVGDSITAL